MHESQSKTPVFLDGGPYQGRTYHLDQVEGVTIHFQRGRFINRPEAWYYPTDRTVIVNGVRHRVFEHGADGRTSAGHDVISLEIDRV